MYLYHMKYVSQEPHRVRALLSEEQKAEALKVMPVEKRRDARLVPFCADCHQPVAVDKLNHYRHVV